MESVGQLTLIYMKEWAGVDGVIRDFILFHLILFDCVPL